MAILISIEGTDGSGKQTQTAKLYDRLSKKYTVRTIAFPDYKSEGSTLVKMYLRGDFGSNPKDVNAYTTSCFYALDRYSSYIMDWSKDYLNKDIIISDRYTTSNMIHQCSKIENKEEKIEFLEWIEDLEYNKLNLPKPDLVLFLNVEIDYSLNLIENRNNKMTGKSEKDIHEKDKEYLRKSYYNALEVAKIKNWKLIDCIENGKMKTIEEIHELIYKEVMEVLK